MTDLTPGPVVSTNNTEPTLDEIRAIIENASVEHYHPNYGNGLFTTDLDSIVEQITERFARLSAQRDTALALHPRVIMRSVDGDDIERCKFCEEEWPCGTARALGVER